MMEFMSVMNQRPDSSLFEQAATHLRIPVAYVEKDWYVTQVIRLIAGVQIPGFEIVFTGGTALAKAHGLLERFSEDVDFRLRVNENLANRKELSNFRKSVVSALRDGGFSFDDKNIRSRDENRFFRIQLPYESDFDRSVALRPHVQIEVIVRQPVLPLMRLPVSSLVTILSKKNPEVAQIACLNPVENAADKISALAWRIPDRVRGSRFDDRAIVRHVHDLARLKDKALESDHFVVLVQKSMSDDEDRPKREDLAALPGQARLELALNILSEDKEYAQEYNELVETLSYAKDVLSYDEALDAVRVLARKVFA